MHRFVLDFGSHSCRPVRTAVIAAVLFVCSAAYTQAWTRHHYGAPVISGTPPTTDTAGKAYSFMPTASAPSGYTISFSISGKPAWASFNTTTGRLSGTPTAANVGTYSNIIISASDRAGSRSLAPFSITVSNPTVSNPPPKISGQPLTSVNVGSPYTFTPTATDSDGDKLTFSVQNKPAWASFSTSTGALSGTPASTYAGTYANIVISVSDGTTSVSLPAFSISVNQVSSGSATLSWTPPTQYSNGSMLTNLAGYKIHYGTSANNLTQTVQVANPGLTSYVLSNLSRATWYFGVTAYTSTGAESAMSNVGSKAVQ
jgi:Putative Ig domain